jgi:hypothetical protein
MAWLGLQSVQFNRRYFISDASKKKKEEYIVHVQVYEETPDSQGNGLVEGGGRDDTNYDKIQLFIWFMDDHSVF